MAESNLANDLKGAVEGLMELEERIRVSGRRNPNRAVSEEKVKEFNLIKTIKYATDGALWVLRNDEKWLKKHYRAFSEIANLKEKELEISHDIPNNLKSIEIELGKLEDKLQRNANEEEIANLVEPLRNHCFNLLKEVEKLLEISIKSDKEFMAGADHFLERIQEADRLAQEINEIFLEPEDPAADLKKPIRFAESLLKKKYNKRKIKQIREELDQMVENEEAMESFAGRAVAEDVKQNLENLEELSEEISEINAQVDDLIRKEMEIDKEIRDEIKDYIHEESRLSELVEHIRGRIDPDTPRSQEINNILESIEMTREAFQLTERVEQHELEDEEILEEGLHDVRNEEKYREKLSDQSNVYRKNISEFKSEIRELKEQMRVIS